MKKFLATLLATAFATSLSLAQVGVPANAGLIPRTATIDVETNYQNNAVETGDISITANFNVVPCWEDDGPGVHDFEAVWKVFDMNGNVVTPGVNITNRADPAAFCFGTSD